MDMDKAELLVIFLAVVVYLTPFSNAAREAKETQLYNYLFTNYSTQLRPIAASDEDHDKQIVVSIKFGIAQVERLNEKDQQLTIHGYMVITWKDELLTWDPVNYGNASFIIVSAESVWLPEIRPGNSVWGSKEVASEKDVTRVRVFSDGTVTWNPAMAMKTSCFIDVTDFPYDKQECDIIYANWLYTIDLLNFTVHPDVATPGLESNIEWTLAGASSYYFTLSSNGVTYPYVAMRIKLVRNPKFFELNVLLPAIMLSGLLIPMFILPVESGEKVSLGITLMLAYSISLLMLNDVTPKSGTIPNLSIALLLCIMFAGLAIFISVLIINVHHHSPYRPVPIFLKTLILGKLACVLCGMKYWDGTSIEPCNSKNNVEVNFEKLKKGQGESKNNTLDHSMFDKAERSVNDITEEIRDDWSKIARILDRLFMVVYIVFFICYTASVLIIKLENGRGF